MSSSPPSYTRPRALHGRGTKGVRHRFIPLQLDSEELEELMEVASGEIVDTPEAGAPYCAIFRFEDEVLFQWPVQTVHEGEARIIEALTFLHARIVEFRDTPPLVIH